MGRLFANKVAADPQVQTHFIPYQSAIGTRGGTESIAHATRVAITRLAPEDMVLLKIDASNAFNAIELELILTSVIETVPGLSRFVHM